MASMPSLDSLKSKVVEIEQRLHDVESIQGQTSDEYRKLLKEFAVAWFTLKMSREKEEFLAEITS